MDLNRVITKKIVIKIALLITISFSVGFNKPLFNSLTLQTEEWKAPPEVNKIKNPFAGDKKYADEGKALYSIYCVSCHGEKGKGDGSASMAIQTKPADHSSGKIQKQSDGAIFWKLTEGRPSMNMVSYKEVLSDNERWFLVNYIRTLSEK